MKLCPQCEFIYEDDQSVCDMDGRELVFDPGPLACEENNPFWAPELQELAPTPASLTAGLPPGQPTGLPAGQPIQWQSRSSAVLALAVIVFAVLLFVVYYAVTHQPRSGGANQASNQTSNQSTQVATAEQEPAPDLVSAPPASLTSLTPSSGQSSSASENVTTSSSSPSSAASFNRARMTSIPVSAGGSAGRRAPVTVWLKNGASIKADEAWEKREGVWYRQGGMVTFLKHSQVRAIQRLAAPNPRSKSVAINAEAKNHTPENAIAQNQPRGGKAGAASVAVNAEEKNRKPENAIAQNQPRAGKPEAASTKKESKVSSFLKKTARILKKPFQF